MGEASPHKRNQRHSVRPGVGRPLFPFPAAPSSSHVQRLHPRPDGHSRQDFLSPPAHLQETGLPDLRMGQGILNAALGTWGVGLRRVDAVRGFQQAQPARSTTIVVRHEMNNSEVRPEAISTDFWGEKPYPTTSAWPAYLTTLYVARQGEEVSEEPTVAGSEISSSTLSGWPSGSS